MNDLKTGDMLLFRGNAWTSRIVTCLTSSKWTHCGMVWKDPPNEKPGLYILESSISEKDDGVQISPLTDYITAYTGEVWVKSITTEQDHRFEKLPLIYARTEGKEYNLLPSDVVRLVNRGGCGWRSYKKRCFVCSTYLAFVYERLGFIASQIDWTIVQPQDFVDDNTYITWINCLFEELERLK